MVNNLRLLQSEIVYIYLPHSATVPFACDIPLTLSGQTARRPDVRPHHSPAADTSAKAPAEGIFHIIRRGFSGTPVAESRFIGDREFSAAPAPNRFCTEDSARDERLIRFLQSDRNDLLRTDMLAAPASDTQHGPIKMDELSLLLYDLQCFSCT